MSASLPVIALQDCEAAGQVITDGETGVICKNTADDLARVLKSLMADPAKREAMGQNALASIEKYNRLNVVAAWNDLIKRLAK